MIDYKNVRILIISTLLLGGCSYYEKQNPKPPIVNTSAFENTSPNLNVEPIALSKWWEGLKDPQLSNLIETGLRQNFDLQLAKSRLKETRAILDINNYALGPSGSVGMGASAVRQSEKGTMPLEKIPLLDRDLTLFQYGYDASWEIDVFGGLRNAIDAADARLQIAELETNGVRLTVAAEIARAYFEFNGSTREKIKMHEYIANLNQSLDLIRLNVSAGNLSHREFDDLSAKKSIYESQLPAVEARANAARIALSILLGTNLQNIQPQAPVVAPHLFAFPIGASSELLTRRPDIRAAEAKLKMRAFEVKYYEAEHFPKFKINAHAGWEARNPLDLFKSSSQALSIGPSIQWRIFDNGRIDAQINAANERENQAMIEYKKIVLGAISDSERALSDYKNSIETIEAKRKVREHQTDFQNHQIARLKAGDISKIEVLDAKRALIETQINEIRSQHQAATYLISLFKALGGGWNENEFAK